jgi:hypothetical protein
MGGLTSIGAASDPPSFDFGVASKIDIIIVGGLTSSG